MHKTPILISGIGRSGTSAVISAISKHKEVLEPNIIAEAPFIKDFVSFLIEFEDDSPIREYNLQNYQLTADERAKEFSSLIAKLQYGLDVNTEEYNDKKYWIAKASLNEQSFQKAYKIMGEVRIIHVIRNGVEVLNSAKNFEGFANLSFEELCHRWVNNLKQLAYVADSPKCAIVRHDELVSDPSKVFDEVYKKIEISPDNAPAEFIGTNLFNSSFDESGKMKSTAQIFHNRLECWSDWSDLEKSTFIEMCDGKMQSYCFARPYE